MKKLLIFIIIFFASEISAAMIEKDDPACILLCDESVEEMQACVLNDSICFLFTSENSPFSTIDPSKIKKVWVEPIQSKKTKEKMKTYCKKYMDKIVGVFFVEMKEGYKIPEMLLKEQK